ncbi:MAG: hypothetical protein V2J62_07815 [candidate division KSB1 bacterium]|nr:hypothetical protein [candidate division KSB1 bacterium]
MMKDIPFVTIVHELPGRLRMRLSVPPKNSRKMITSVKDHAGIQKIVYTPVSKSVLIEYDPGEVTREEMLIRVGLYLSLDYGSRSVRIFSQPMIHEMSDSAFYSGISLLIALLFRVFRGTAKNVSWTEWTAGASTALAALEHGWSEVKKRGNFDPEVLSVVYLLIALIRGNFLPAAVVTWISTFGRHLVKMPSRGVELRPVEVASGKKTREKEYEVEVSNVHEEDDKMMFFSMVPAILKFAFTGDSTLSNRNLIDQIQRVSGLHGEVLEGLGSFQNGIPLKIKDQI